MSSHRRFVNTFDAHYTIRTMVIILWQNRNKIIPVVFVIEVEPPCMRNYRPSCIWEARGIQQGRLRSIDYRALKDHDGSVY